MSVASKIIALVETLKLDPKAFERMRPAERRHFAQICRYVADQAEPPTDQIASPRMTTPKSGVLYDLRFGRQE